METFVKALESLSTTPFWSLHTPPSHTHTHTHTHTQSLVILIQFSHEIQHTPLMMYAWSSSLVSYDVHRGQFLSRLLKCRSLKLVNCPLRIQDDDNDDDSVASGRIWSAHKTNAHECICCCSCCCHPAKTVGIGPRQSITPTFFFLFH